MSTRRFPLMFHAGRLLLLLVLVSALLQIRHEKSPAKSAWGRHLVEKKEPTFKEHVQAGLWYGAAARAAVAGALLLLSVAWRPTPKESGPRLALGEGEADRLRAPVFYGGLVVIFAAAVALRLPRMTHSFWGDEADAIATYVHGAFKPADRGQLQGPLVFDPVTWAETFFGASHGPNNHVLFSVLARGCLETWRSVTHQPATAFAEWPCRVPPLIGGLGSLVLLATLLRRWGASGAGLLATAFVALHPWHVRYSTEARGYAVMLCLLMLLLHLLTFALERSRWRDWLAVALCQFLMLWAWAGSAYVLFVVNVAMGVLILAQRKDWLPAVAQWLTSGLLAAGAFASLYLPLLLQIQRVQLRSGWMKGRPMNAQWLHNLLAQPFTGIPYHEEDTTNPFEVSWQRLLHDAPTITALGFAAAIIVMGWGLVVLWKRNRSAAMLVTAILGAMPLSALHFYYGLKVELLAWYWIFSLPCLGACFALGAFNIARRGVLRYGLAVVLLAVATAATWPMTHSEVQRPTEDYRTAMQVTRGHFEKVPELKSSNIFTIWLWRSSDLYDPRGDTHVRDAAALQKRMEEVKAAKGQLYVVIGYRTLVQSLNADMLRLVEDPALFEKRDVLWAQEALHTLTVYRMK